MVNTYMKIGAIAGPLTPNNVTLPPGQLTGFSLNGVFKINGWTTGLASPSNLFAKGTSQASGKPTPAEVSIDFYSTTASPDLFKAAATGAVQTRACFILTNNATGGIANEWVQHYWLFENAVVTSYQSTIYDEPPGYQQMSLSYKSAYQAFFATPSGGVLGARTAYGFSYASNTEW